MSWNGQDRIRVVGVVEKGQDARTEKIGALKRLWDALKAKKARDTHRSIFYVEHPSAPNQPEKFDFRAERSDRPTDWYELCEREFGR